MEYKGKLYGKIGGKYFETGKTADDWDELEKFKQEFKYLDVSFFNKNGTEKQRNHINQKEVVFDELNYGKFYDVDKISKAIDLGFHQLKTRAERKKFLKESILTILKTL